jgi:hypothetical protein
MAGAGNRGEITETATLESDRSDRMACKFAVSISLTNSSGQSRINLRSELEDEIREAAELTLSSADIESARTNRAQTKSASRPGFEFVRLIVCSAMSALILRE